MIKTMSPYCRPLIPSLWQNLFARFTVGGALCPDSNEPSRRKAAPTARHRATAFGLGLFAFSVLIAAAAPAPEISLSLRGVGDGIVEQGEPLRIAVRVRAPRGAKEAFTLSPASGTWADAIRVEIVPATGGAIAAQAEAVGKPDAAQATLDKTHLAGGLWHFTSTAMQGLAPGNYLVRSRLTIAGGSGWTGEVVSTPAQLQVVALSNAADRVTQRTVNRAYDALLVGHGEEAAAMLDAVLIKSPDDTRLLMARAVVAEQAGNILAAILCANRAERARPLASKGLPPVELQELQTRLQQALPEAMKRSDKPAEWTWPPASVMSVSEPMLSPGSKNNAVSVSAAAASIAPVTKPISVAPLAASTAPAVVPAPVSASVPAPPMFSVASAGAPSPGEIVPWKQMTDATVSADSAGQWAVAAKAGSQYGTPTYSAARATGAPDVPVTGDSPSAWCPAAQGGTDWLEVSFAKPVNATEVRVRQSNCPGAIVKIETFEADGTSHLWWEGSDAYKPSAVREIVWFVVRVPKTPYLVTKVKITLNLSAVPGWKQIDAVQLVGAP